MKQSLSLFACGAALVFATGVAFAQEDDAPKDDAPVGDATADDSKDEAKPRDTTPSKSDDEIAADADAEEEAAKAKAKAEADAQLPADEVVDTRKIRLGLRLGYGLPLGDVVSGASLSDVYSGMIPIRVDAGYMVTPEILLGVYFQYAIAFVKDSAGGGTCEAVDCSGSSIRFGIQGQYHLGVGKKLDPWVGLGIGYESAGVSVGDGSTSFNGLEFLNLQGGADFAIADALAVGPFLSFSVGQYSSQGQDPEPAGYSGSIQDKGVHMWLVIGAKGTFAL
jgi:hypothetical protein